MGKVRVLILGSDRRMYRLICRLAERAGFESYCVTRPEAFQASCQEFQPDCVFLDPDLAGIDCGEVFHFLAKENADATVIPMGATRYAGAESLQALGKSLGLNMLGSLSNEFDIDDINAKLEQIRRLTP